MARPQAQPASIPEHQADPWAHPGVVQTIAASGIAKTLDLSAYDTFDITLTGNLVLTFANAEGVGDVHQVTIRFVQDATHGRTVTWPASVKWAGGAAPTITAAAAGNQDIVTLRTYDGGVTWLGTVAQAFA